jgi:hypothetical protein
MGQPPAAALRRFRQKTQRNPRSQKRWPIILSTRIALIGVRPVQDDGRAAIHHARWWRRVLFPLDEPETATWAVEEGSASIYQDSHWRGTSSGSPRSALASLATAVSLWSSQAHPRCLPDFSRQARSLARLVAIADQLMRCACELKRAVFLQSASVPWPNAVNFASTLQSPDAAAIFAAEGQEQRPR